MSTAGKPESGPERLPKPPSHGDDAHWKAYEFALQMHQVLQDAQASGQLTASAKRMRDIAEQKRSEASQLFFSGDVAASRITLSAAVEMYKAVPRLVLGANEVVYRNNKTSIGLRGGGIYTLRNGVPDEEIPSEEFDAVIHATLGPKTVRTPRAVRITSGTGREYDCELFWDTDENLQLRLKTANLQVRILSSRDAVLALCGESSSSCEPLFDQFEEQSLPQPPLRFPDRIADHPQWPSAEYRGFTFLLSPNGEIYSLEKGKKPEKLFGEGFDSTAKMIVAASYAPADYKYLQPNAQRRGAMYWFPKGAGFKTSEQIVRETLFPATQPSSAGQHAFKEVAIADKPKAAPAETIMAKETAPQPAETVDTLSVSLLELGGRYVTFNHPFYSAIDRECIGIVGGVDKEGNAVMRFSSLSDPKMAVAQEKIPLAGLLRANPNGILENTAIPERMPTDKRDPKGNRIEERTSPADAANLEGLRRALVGAKGRKEMLSVQLPRGRVSARFITMKGSLAALAFRTADGTTSDENISLGLLSKLNPGGFSVVDDPGGGLFASLDNLSRETGFENVKLSEEQKTKIFAGARALLSKIAAKYHSIAFKEDAGYKLEYTADATSGIVTITNPNAVDAARPHWAITCDVDGDQLSFTGVLDNHAAPVVINSLTEVQDFDELLASGRAVVHEQGTVKKRGREDGSGIREPVKVG